MNILDPEAVLQADKLLSLYITKKYGIEPLVAKTYVGRGSEEQAQPEKKEKSVLAKSIKSKLIDQKDEERPGLSLLTAIDDENKLRDIFIGVVKSAGVDIAEYIKKANDTESLKDLKKLIYDIYLGREKNSEGWTYKQLKPKKGGSAMTALLLRSW